MKINMKKRRLNCVLAVFVWTATLVSSTSKYNTINKKDASDYSPNGGGLFPTVFNLASRASVHANATCGEDGPELFCKLVEHAGMREPQCGVCDSLARSHPVSHAIDGTPRWWQSPSLQNGARYEWVTVTLDLKQVYQVAYVIVKSAISPRPANWILERSLDGDTYWPWQYYAQTDEECWTFYGLPPTPGKPTYKSDSDVICTSFYSKLNPLEGGEIHTSLVNGRPGANESSAELLQFTLARFVRLRMQKIRTLNAEFMSVSPGIDDASVTRRLFYSIKDISIGGQCVCSGHASSCTQNGKLGQPQCECQHNTCGPSCEECCPLFNQHIWRAGTPQDSAQCEPCECFGHAESCRYDPDIATARLSLNVDREYKGGGFCENCTAHTTGINCEQCEDGWFRPSGVAHDNPTPCVPCQCDSLGTTGHCTKDDSQREQVAGQCGCKEGFGGVKCDECAPRFRHYPRCEPCPCDARGSEAANCESDCVCKSNVEGEHCNRCKEGYFYLNEKNPHGCTQCYCSGVSRTCKSSDMLVEMVSTLSDWLVSDLVVTRTVLPTVHPKTSHLIVGNYELPGVESYYWLAPDLFRGNQLSSYSTNISFSVEWVVMRGDTSGKPTVGPNIILVGNNGLRLGYGQYAYRKTNVTITVPLLEGSWYLIPDGVKDIMNRPRRTEYRGERVSRAQLLSVLANVRHLLLRAKFHSDQVECSLRRMSMQVTSSSGYGVANHHVESCQCPPGYAGLSCEACQYGYVSITSSSTDVASECRKCQCNGHAATCNAITGQCGPCEHNTTGLQCDACISGYYGDAKQGTTSDCQPCACPLLESSNNFSPTCKLQPHDKDSKAYTCTACPPGYSGSHCELCSSGYYGNPTELGSSCQLCDCTGGPCDGQTGQCLRCHGNTEGWRCERCLPSHYGNPIEADCKPCRCHHIGSISTESCDKNTGQCDCYPRFTGRMCDQCQIMFGNISAGCVPCNCHVSGSLSATCDAATGHCLCRSGVGGPHCDRCHESHYGFSNTGCIGCGCNLAGSLQKTCDIVTGQCSCRPHVTGRTCDTCEIGYWGLSSTGECHPCDCDPIGVASISCDGKSGQCHCKPGVGGHKCDKCLPRFYGFSATGCSECEHCDKAGHLCDPDTGRCICPPYTAGQTCDRCQPNAWGYEPNQGCKPCGCELTGSLHGQCDTQTGHCSCREGYRGNRCAECEHYYHGFPHCRRCDCHIAGTQESRCDSRSGQCWCNDSGQCPCKANVAGKKCQHCKEGTFGLQADNPDGCTQCFCFGRSTACTQAGLTWSQLMMPRPRTVTIEYDTPTPHIRGAKIYPVSTHEICFINLAVPGVGEFGLNATDSRLNVTNNLYIIPGDAGDVKMGVSYLFDAPIYWKLPHQFLGDRVLSYGGYLRFSTHSEGGNTLLPPHVLATYPLVQLQGHQRLILEHFPVLSPSNRHAVRFHESLWQMKNNPSGKVTREMLMVALQNVKHILIRASDSLDFTKVVLRDVKLDTAIAAPGQPSPLARGVELCSCPPQYNSSSCQDPSIGFYRWYDRNSVSSTIVIKLVGEARPCECNERSTVCNIETGHCLNCSDNTGGAHCERCAEGYYGDPALGPCKPCPCPSPAPGRNFAVSCRVDLGKVTCYCREGYTGKRCDRCVYGWYGFPKQEGGSCVPCRCNPYGSVSDECDEETGQCNCRPGITSRDCSQCQEKHVLTQHGCKSCDDGCTGVLLAELVDMAARLAKNTSHLSGGIVPPPWGRLLSIEGNAEDQSRRLQKWLEIVRRATELPDQLPDDLIRRAKVLLNKSKKLEKISENAALDGVTLKNEAGNYLTEITTLQNDINGVVLGLLNYGQGETGAVSVDAALEEAQHLLKDINHRDLKSRKDAAQQVLRKCKQLLNHIKRLLKDRPDISPLQERLDQLLDRLDNLQAILRNTTNTLNKAKMISSQNEDKFQNAESNVKIILDKDAEIEMLSDEAQYLVENATVLLQQANHNIKLFRVGQEEFLNLTKAVEEREGILYRLNPLYKEKYVVKAQEHADLLFNRAQQYRDLFNATRQDADFALRASKAYQGIVDALHDAKESAVNANVAADVAYHTAYPGSKEDSLLEKSKDTMTQSQDLLNNAKRQAQKVEAAQMQFKREKVAVDRLRDTVEAAGEQNNAVIRELQKLNSDQIQKSTAAAMKDVEMLKNISSEINTTALRVSNDVRIKLRPLLEKLGKEQDLGMIDSQLNQARLNIERSKELWVRLNNKSQEQKKKFDRWNNTFATQLQDLRNKITQARHAADGIHLSVTNRIGGSGCVRSYRPGNLAPSTTTSIVLSYAIESDDKDASLFYLSSDTHNEFAALEMVNRTIRFVWNAGGGLGVVTHPRPIETGILKEDKSWYRIQVERTSNIARLSVRHQVLPDGSPEASEQPVSNSSEAGFGTVNVGPKDEVWIGGLPPRQSRHPQLLATGKGLAGCMHQLILDGRPLGLWNFASETPKGGCTACIQGAEESKDEQSYRFTGDGYSMQNATNLYDKLKFSVSLKFRTLDENALLFMAVNKRRDQFVALMLSNGHVLFRIGYGGSSRLELTTKRKFNTGVWIQCEALRFFTKKLEQALLRVEVDGESESLNGSPTYPPNEDAIPDIVEYLIGGIAPGFALAPNMPELPGSFLGCMSDIQVLNSGLNPLSGKFYGIEASCSMSYEVVSFQGNGYIQLKSHTLNKKKASFEFVFRTLQSDVLLMLTTSQGKDPPYGGYYSVALHDGRLVVWVNSGTGRTVMESKSSFNDGQFHAVSVTKQRRRLELRVDDIEQGNAVMPDGDSAVQAPGKNGGLYLGGVAPNIRTNELVPNNIPLIGTIKDAIFNSQLLKLEEPVSFEHAAIGRAGPETPLEEDSETFIVPLASPPSECQKVASYSVEPDAVKLGDSASSYIHMKLDRKNNLQKNFVLEFGFRSYYPSGLLFIMPGTRKKQHHYFMAALRNKQLIVEVKGRRKVDLVAPLLLNDGLWHHVSLQRDNRKLSLIVDLKTIGQTRLPKKLSIGNVMYIGGLPSNGHLLPNNLLQRLETFRGCLRQLTVNKQPEDLVGPRATPKNVGQCFPEVERGSYFPGDAYAVYDNEFQISDLQELELEFRTSELSGILLSVPLLSGSPALSLELSNGKVVMTCDMGDKKPLRVEQEFPSRFTVCDNKWHSIHAVFDVELLQLKVDNFPIKYALSRNGVNVLDRTSSPLYIGGLPDNGTESRETRENFKGCIRNVVIGRKRKDWTDMAALKNILLSSCPVSS